MYVVKVENNTFLQSADLNFLAVLFTERIYINLIIQSLSTGQRLRIIGSKKPHSSVMLIFIAIFTCLPSCINLSNAHSYISVNQLFNPTNSSGDRHE